MTRLPMVLCLALLLTPGCAPKTIQDPATRAAFTAGQIVTRVNELENAAIQANGGGGGLDLQTTRTIVSFCVTADKTLKELPNGWQATVSRAWMETKRALPPVTNAAVGAAINAVDIILATQGL